MFAKAIMKNPVLIIGILLMVIFMFTLRDKGYLGSRNRKLKATSCQSVMVMLGKRLPENWKGNCNDNNLELLIEIDLNRDDFKKVNNFRAVMYREMANDLMFVSKNSPEDGLSRVFVVTMKLVSSKIDISAVTEGKYLANMASLKSAELIAEHLRANVTVKESLK